MSEILTLSVVYVVFIIAADGEEVYAVYDDEEDAANIVDFLMSEGSEAHYVQVKRNYPKIVISEDGDCIMDDDDTRH